MKERLLPLNLGKLNKEIYTEYKQLAMRVLRNFYIKKNYLYYEDLKQDLIIFMCEAATKSNFDNTDAFKYFIMKNKLLELLRSKFYRNSKRLREINEKNQDDFQYIEKNYL